MKKLILLALLLGISGCKASKEVIINYSKWYKMSIKYLDAQKKLYPNDTAVDYRIAMKKNLFKKSKAHCRVEKHHFLDFLLIH